MKYIVGIISILVLIIALVGGAYYLGTKSTTNKAQMSISPAPTSFVTAETPTPTTANQTKTITAGGILVFSKYSVTFPSDWVSEHLQSANNDTLTLTKLGYKLEFSQYAGGGGGCIYPQDKPADMAQNFTSFVEITNPNGYVFRRGRNDSAPNTYTICQKNAQDGSFGFPTNFGQSMLIAPGTPEQDTTILPEVDAILASIKKI